MRTFKWMDEKIQFSNENPQMGGWNLSNWYENPQMGGWNLIFWLYENGLQVDRWMKTYPVVRTSRCVDEWIVEGIASSGFLAGRWSSDEVGGVSSIKFGCILSKITKALSFPFARTVRESKSKAPYPCETEDTPRIVAGELKKKKKKKRKREVLFGVCFGEIVSDGRASCNDPSDTKIMFVHLGGRTHNKIQSWNSTWIQAM